MLRVSSCESHLLPGKLGQAELTKVRCRVSSGNTGTSTDTIQKEPWQLCQILSRTAIFADESESRTVLWYLQKAQQSDTRGFKQGWYCSQQNGNVSTGNMLLLLQSLLVHGPQWDVPCLHWVWAVINWWFAPVFCTRVNPIKWNINRFGCEFFVLAALGGLHL